MARPRPSNTAGVTPVYTPVDRNYKDRVRRILADETYGPRLARLNQTDQQTVLQLIYHGDSRGARRTILNLDRARLDKRTLAGRARRYAALPPDRRSATWNDVRDRAHADDQDRQFWELYKNILRG